MGKAAAIALELAVLQALLGAGIVAFADVADSRTLEPQLDVLSGSSRVKGIRQNIQGQPPGFALQPAGCKLQVKIQGPPA